MPGRFHPFHRGHAAGYKQLADQFGVDNTYLAISAKQELPKSPFSAADRSQMAELLGVPASKILIVKQPYKNDEYMALAGSHPEQTSLVFGISKKDMEGDPEKGILPDPRFSFGTKKDGSPTYMQPYTGKDMEPMTKHAYVMSTDVGEFPIAGKIMRDATAIRTAYAKGDDRKKLKILQDLYGDGARQMKPIFDKNLQITENVKKLVSAIKPLIESATPEQKQRFLDLLENAKQQMLEKEEKGRDQERRADPKDNFPLSVDPEYRLTLDYAKQHYPMATSKEEAFVKFVQRSLKHSKETAEELTEKIEKLYDKVGRLETAVKKLGLRRTDLPENKDYTQEK